MLLFFYAPSGEMEPDMDAQDVSNPRLIVMKPALR
jgi:hypothetical protein